MLNSETADLSIPVIEAVFSKRGNTRDYWTEQLQAGADEIALTWYDIGEPLLVHMQPNDMPERPYGVFTILMQALGARLTVNGVQASGHEWPLEREGRPFRNENLITFPFTHGSLIPAGLSQIGAAQALQRLQASSDHPSVLRCPKWESYLRTVP